MFLDELNPIFKELAQQPVAFLGGLVSGLLRLKLDEDPVRTWLDRQAGISTDSATPAKDNGKTSGPQPISID